MDNYYVYELINEENSDFGKNPEDDLNYLLKEIKKRDNGIKIEYIQKAFWYAYDKHKNIVRKSGLPYYTHPLNTALILIREFPIIDNQLVAGALLHDVIEDNETVEKEDIIENFDEELAIIVDGVTKISHQNLNLDLKGIDDNPKNTQIKIEGGDTSSYKEYKKIKPHKNNINSTNKIEPSKAAMDALVKSQTYRKLFEALVKDVRVLLIKLADRMHNLRTLQYLKESKQESISKETLNFYVPFAHRLGLNKIKQELENRAFYFIAPAEYESIREELNTKRRDFVNYIKVFTDLIQSSLDQNNLEHTLSVVHKQEYEIRLMKEEGKNISDIDNFYSVVIILHTDDVHECYRAHGVLATAFNAISFADYISHPKVDWYRSLYTELYGPDGKRVEILIRTKEMEKIAEEGFAAKYSLKDGRVRALEFTDSEISEWSDWMQDIIQEHYEKATQMIWNSIKVNLFDSALIVFSKEGKQIKLPEGSSVLDYAFALGEEIGLTCIAGKVNGVTQDISYKLRSSDQVDIITSKNVNLKPEWQNYVVSHRAVVKLHNYFKNNPILNFENKKTTKLEQIRLEIKGEDRVNMLNEITDAIGKNNIRRINLDTTGHNFEGAITVVVPDNNELKSIFNRLLNIKGVRSVVRGPDNIT